MSITSWYKNRAIAGGVLVLLGMPYLFSLASDYKHRKVLEKTEVVATIKTTEIRGKEDFKHFKTTLLLPDGETIELKLAPSHKPHPGDQKTLVRTVRESGKVEYKIKREPGSF